MKKNLISIAILVLLIVNIVLTSIMMFSIVNTNRKTAAFVTEVASAIQLELDTNEGEAEAVSIDNIDAYTISDLTIQLKPTTTTDSDGETTSKVHYVSTSVVLSMNKTDEDYATYSADLDNKADLIKGEITEAFSQYTMEEASADSSLVTDDILNRIQTLYNSDFIFDVTLSNPLYQ